MLHHIVMWTLKDEAEGEKKAANLAKAAEMLKACADLTPGILRFEVGTAQPGMEATCDLLLCSAFADRTALAAYQNHPDHLAMKPFMKTVVASRQCFDYEA
ncbi:MAG TPA: Dabb family protein [Hydrogenophaga sp.]|nr:Dabb family protein [Hydrogenophaga sp.]